MLSLFEGSNLVETRICVFLQSESLELMWTFGTVLSVLKFYHMYLAFVCQFQFYVDNTVFIYIYIYKCM